MVTAEPLRLPGGAPVPIYAAGPVVQERRLRALAGRARPPRVRVRVRVRVRGSASGR